MPEPIPFPSSVSPVRRALLSVHDKAGITELAGELVSQGTRLVSTGGTAARSSGGEVATGGCPVPRAAFGVRWAVPG